MTGKMSGYTPNPKCECGHTKKEHILRPIGCKHVILVVDEKKHYYKLVCDCTGYRPKRRKAGSTVAKKE
jgi:predicted nucleic-acid-binding Zn-ribbon protein